MKYSIVIALLLASTDAIKLRSKLPALPPADAVASTILSTANQVSSELSKNKGDIGQAVEQTLVGVEGALQSNIGLTLPPGRPSGEIIVDGLQGAFEQGNSQLQAHKDEIVGEVAKAEEDIQRVAKDLGLAQTTQPSRGQQLLEQSIPPAEVIVGMIKQTAENLPTQEIQGALNGFADDVRRAGGKVDGNFPKAEQITGGIQGIVAQNEGEIKNAIAGTREGLIRAAGDMGLAQISQPGDEEQKIAKEVEDKADKMIGEAKKKGYKVRIPKNAKEAREDFETDLEALDKELKDGDFDDEIREFEEFAKREGHDFDPEDAKHLAEELIEEEEGEIEE